MKVFLTTDTVGGVWDYTLTLVTELCARGNRVFLAVLGSPDGDRLGALPPGVEVAFRELRLEWMPDAAEAVAEGGEWLAGEARRWGAEVVHLNQLAYASRDFAAPTVVAVHSDVLSWFSETRGVSAPAEWREYAEWVRAGLAAADVVVAPTAYQSALTLRQYGRAADRVIHNGVHPPAEPPSARLTPRLISVGRAWDEAKGMAVLDAAVGLLGDDAPPSHLFGDTEGPHGQRFQPRHLRAYGRAPREEIDRWMGTATLYVGASLYEPFGLAPLEAALHGCALVLSDIPSFRELWDDCAEFFPRGDARALAEALQRLSRDPARSAALALAACSRARGRYSAERFAREYLELYEEVVGCRSSAVGSPPSVRV